MGMNKKQYERWEKIRKQGKNSFVWRMGVMFWGITTAILWVLLMHFIFHTELTWRSLVIALIVFPIAGCFWAMSVWHINEKSFRNYTPSS
jgi:hypothetical protein